MKFRTAALALTSLLAASHAGASILSASSQAVREPSAASANWNASTLQHDLNATLELAAKAAAPVGPVASSPAPASGGLLVNSGSSGPSFSPFIESPALDDLFAMPNDQHTIGIARDSWTIGKPDVAGNPGGGIGNRKDPDKEKDRDRQRDNPYATPEPSTWMLLGSGLLMLAGYAVVRRRTALQF
jgi:hypothetical protein